jgi:inositol oxygenase
MQPNLSDKEKSPLDSIENWEDDLLVRYPEPKEKQAKAKDDYSNYHDSERVDTVRDFYKLNHTYQTYDFVIEKEKEFLKI